MTRVLVVDDSAVDQKLAGGLLQKQAEMIVSFASDGKQALAAIGAEMPDMVVTDLRMPGMNGLDLVRAIRDRFPLLPVILMTAQGSEEIAVEALRAGAASYVPKAKLARNLLDTVESVLSVARAHRHHARLLDCVTRQEWFLEMDNDPSLVASLVDHLRQNISRMGLGDEMARIRLAVALEEALLNALYHGNLEISSELREDDARQYYRLAEERRQQPPYRDRRLYVEARVSRSEANYVVRDQGPGFDPDSLPDPTDPANLEKISGRGLLLIRTFMDEVQHNASGNEITMIKRFEVPSPVPC